MLADGTSRQDVIDKLLELLTFDGGRSNAVTWALVPAELDPAAEDKRKARDRLLRLLLDPADSYEAQQITLS